MATISNSELRRALAERVRFYNELGIYDFYAREPRTARDEVPVGARYQAVDPVGWRELPAIDAVDKLLSRRGDHDYRSVMRGDAGQAALEQFPRRRDLLTHRLELDCQTFHCRSGSRSTGINRWRCGVCGLSRPVLP